VDEQPDTEQLRLAQLEREAEESERARTSLDEDEAAQHRRRAEKAHYLRERLEERAESEREDEQS
jgi:hypothetical protein